MTINLQPNHIVINDTQTGEPHKFRAIIQDNLAIHKLDAVPMDDRTCGDEKWLDYNEPGWAISELKTGRVICNNDWTPFYEAVNTLLALLPLVADIPALGTPDFEMWLLEKQSALEQVVNAYVNW